MYHGTAAPRSARSHLDTPPEATPEAAAQRALARVRKLLTGYVPGMPIDVPRLQADLAVSLPAALPESERLFARGWLCWLEGSPETAEALFHEATTADDTDGALEALAEAAYWRGRVQLQRERPDALARFESVLRKLAGSPQGTVWFIDLLWRGGRIDRAEQVWKSVRGNRRVMTCPEAPLLEARMLLRRGELAPAERLLQDLAPQSGVLWVERLLLLAWLRALQRQGEQTRALLQQAGQGPYPASALQLWSLRLEQRLRGETAGEEPADAAPALRDYLAGQQARQAGQTDAALSAYRAALQSPTAQPFARYALAVLGQESWAALLASGPGHFLAARCRAWLTRERFRQRQASPAEWLEALRQATALGYQSPPAEHFRRLALVLQERQATPEQLQSLAAESANGLRVAVELAVRTLPPEAARELLLAWSQSDLAGDEGLRTLLGRHLLRSVLLDPLAAPSLQDTIARLLPGEPLAALARADGGPNSTLAAFLAEGVPTSVNGALVQLAWAGRLLAAGPSPEEAEPWRQRVRQVRSVGRLKGMAQALLVQEAAERGDAAGVAALLEETDAWRGAASMPPDFVLRAVEHVATLQPPSAGWQRSLARWLEVWDRSRLTTRAEGLLVQAGLMPLSGETAQPPAGMAAVPWLLHQAARALGRDDARTGLALVRRVLVLEGDTTPEAVKAALPDLERWARAQTLGSLIQDSSAAGASAQLVDLADLLESMVEGQAVLAAVERGEHDEARVRLETLALREDMPPRLAHHLALLAQRAALPYEQTDSDEAIPSWRLAWRCWLRFLAAEPTPDARRVLLHWLLSQQRRRLEDLLARNAVATARHYWDLVLHLPELARDEALRQDLAERIERFRDELATDYLVGTREAMRYGAIPEGWRADYDKGLTYLRRLLSLDRDNPRLLAALVEICTEWFLDLYHASAMPLLQQQVERFNPFALHLARLIDGRPADLTARAALAEFWKFRGFVAPDRQQKIALYQEALRFHPANSNVQGLLAALESPGEKESDA